MRKKLSLILRLIGLTLILASGTYVVGIIEMQLAGILQAIGATVLFLGILLRTK